MSKKTKRPPMVNYTSRDFTSIKDDLVQHAKRYYPNSFQDFSEASFGSMMLDTVAYVGDMLSFYLDYQANESFIDSAVEPSNVIRHARRLGYRETGKPGTAQGIISVYITIPANTTGGGPNLDYAPIVRRGAHFKSAEGTSYVLTEDIDFGNTELETVVAEVDPDTGTPTSYAIKGRGFIISGAYFEADIPIGEYVPFRALDLADSQIVEIVEVTDASGNPYYEVDYLSQDTVYLPVKNPSYDNTSGQTQFLLKPYAVPRRFTTDFSPSRVRLTFGAGSPQELADNLVADPSKVVLNQYSKDYIADRSFDPSRLLQTDKLGIGPENTTLRIIYRVNDGDILGNANASTGAITEILKVETGWKDTSQLSTATMNSIRQSIEVSNEVPIIGDSSEMSLAEIRSRARAASAAQNRCVTKEDYCHAVYSMPGQFGRVKRCNIVQDHNSFKRNLNMYVISEGPTGNLMTTADSIKNNIKAWLQDKKMVNDTIDILNARVVNLGVEYSIVVRPGHNRYDTLQECQLQLRRYFSTTQPMIGEAFSISAIYKMLNILPGVMDVVDVNITQKSGGLYSDIKFNIFAQTTPDQLFVKVPSDVIWEIFDPTNDCKGAVH